MIAEGIASFPVSGRLKKNPPPHAGDFILRFEQAYQLFISPELRHRGACRQRGGGHYAAERIAYVVAAAGLEPALRFPRSRF
jgi:hypothetical protein